jgi:C4-dicarboxylate transporter
MNLVWFVLLVCTVLVLHFTDRGNVIKVLMRKKTNYREFRISEVSQSLQIIYKLLPILCWMVSFDFDLISWNEKHLPTKLNVLFVYIYLMPTTWHEIRNV